MFPWNGWYKERNEKLYYCVRLTNGSHAQKSVERCKHSLIRRICSFANLSIHPPPHLWLNMSQRHLCICLRSGRDSYSWLQCVDSLVICVAYMMMYIHLRGMYGCRVGVKCSPISWSARTWISGFDGSQASDRRTLIRPRQNWHPPARRLPMVTAVAEASSATTTRRSAEPEAATWRDRRTASAGRRASPAPMMGVEAAPVNTAVTPAAAAAAQTATGAATGAAPRRRLCRGSRGETTPRPTTTSP